jgi:hypothetical protein
MVSFVLCDLIQLLFLFEIMIAEHIFVIKMSPSSVYTPLRDMFVSNQVLNFCLMLQWSRVVAEIKE